MAVTMALCNSYRKEVASGSEHTLRHPLTMQRFLIAFQDQWTGCGELIDFVSTHRGMRRTRQKAEAICAGLHSSVKCACMGVVHLGLMSTGMWVVSVKA
jgi:hypothetical protein